MLITSGVMDTAGTDTDLIWAQSTAEAAANAAAAAYWSWTSLASETRAAHLTACAAALEGASDHLTRIAAEEIGAAATWVGFNVSIAARTLRQSCDLMPLMRDQVFESEDGATRSILRRQSVGVVLGFAPWNAPIALAVRAMAAPLACGNTVVLKASEHCPKTHEAVVDIMRQAGLPDGVATVVTNTPDQSARVMDQLIAHPAIRRVNFTGSTRVGRTVAQAAAKHLKKCLLELSDKASLIVLHDADLDAAARAAVFGAFFNQGQICMSTERIIVQDGIADDLIERILSLHAGLRAADPHVEAAPLGRLINADAASRVRGLIDDALSKGAHLLAGGDVDGAVIQPAVIDHVTSSMRLYHEESFGPVAAISRVRDVEEAVSMANDTEFGWSSPTEVVLRYV